MAQRLSALRVSAGPALPSMEAPIPLPFPPGKNPFRIKGTVLWGFFEYIDGRVPGGIAAVRARLAEPLVREFSEQAFVAAGWYDFLPVLQILAAAASAANIPVAQFIADHAAWQTERDVNGIHRLLLKLASPEAVARRFPLAFGRYFDFADVSVEVEKGRSVVTVRGLPALLFDWYLVSVGAGAGVLLRLAGGKRIEASYTPPVTDGQKQGIRTVGFTVTRTWTT
jgi:hypothetical protein